MKILALFAASLVAIGSGPAAAPVAAAASTDRAALEALNGQWLNAYKTRDGAALQRILADDFESVYPGDRVLKKADVIAAATGTTRIVETVAWENLRIMVFGDTAVVSGRAKLSGTIAGKPFATANDYADIYARRGGRWVAISAHVVPAPPAPRPA
jgi:ketosteroid isomerase-like protein